MKIVGWYIQRYLPLPTRPRSEWELESGFYPWSDFQEIVDKFHIKSEDLVEYRPITFVYGGND